MVSQDQKPIQKERDGEFLEGLPGFTKSVACLERNAQELGRPESSHVRKGKADRNDK